MTPDQKTALKQALDQHSFRMSVKDAAPEDIAQLPENFQVPSYSANTSPLYENQLFPKITSADDLINLGYATPEGVPTESGQMAIALKKAGALNDDYTLNDTGKTMMASREDILKEENIDLYREYKRLELDEAPDVGIWDMAKGIAADLVKGANAIAENELGGIKDIASSQAFGGAFEPYGAESLTPEKKAESRIKTEEAAKDLFVSSAGLARAAATEIDKVAAKTMWDGMMQDYQVSYLEQKYDRDLADMEKVNTSEVADELAKVIGLSTQFAEGRQQAEELIGPEATKKAIEEGRAAGLALSVVNPLAPEALVASTAFGVARKGVSAAFKPISRKLLESEAKAAQALQASQRVTGLQGNLAQVNYLAQKAEQEAIFAERQADKYSKLGLSNRANDARTFADKLRTRGLEAGAKVQGLTDEIARASEEASKLAQDAAVADKINFIAQKAREIPGLPIQAIGGLVEGTGMAMIGIDKGLSKLASKIGADKAYNAMNKITTLSGVGTLASVAGLGPAAFIPAAIKTAWSTAPFLKGAGHFVRMIGKETANARELIPFWQRVSNYETLGATQRSIAHLMDTSTLGSRVTGLAGDVAKGVAASYPIDLAFEWISDGGEMDMNTLKQAAAETVVFGGGGALGGITAGSKERIKKLQRGSALNFYRNIKDGGQRVAFNALNDGMKRSVGTYASAFPNLNIRFTDQGGGAFDPASNTAFINPMSRNPLKPLLAHEINHYILIRNQMEGGISAALVGDGVQTGGLLRGKDGTLDENFLAFKEEYTRRLEAQHNKQINQKIASGEKIPAKQRQFIAPTDNDIAIEYFVDSMADDMMEMAETGELGKQAGRMLVTRKMQAFGNAILQKAPIIKDFFYKIGGVTDQNGRAVYGNGLLAEGIREIPQMKKLFRQMISESAGRPMHVAKVTKGESEGHTIPITGKNDPILDEMTSMYESDQDGVPLRDKNGDRIPLSDETEKLRASSGLLLLEDQENRLNRGETLEPGELRFNPEENAWTGEYLTDRQLQILRASGRFNNVQLKQLELLNGAAEENTGRRFLVFNQPATKKRKGKRLAYETLGISMREIVPYGIKITKDGNILVRLMSVQQLHANAFEKAASKRGQSLYRGDVEAILRDVNQVIENHGRNEPTDAYFKKEYGTEWDVRKNFINTVFGNVGKGQKDINPLLSAEKAKNAVVKTYRIDRINKATELEGRTKLPYQNHLVKVNFMPEGEPILDANGEPKDLRYTPRAEDRMPEQRQMPEVEAPAPSQTRFMPEGVDEDKFYSQLDRVITDKVPSRATPQQIMATIDPTRGSGVKAEEIKWSGIEQALASLEKDGKVSKDDLLNYLRNEGRVRFEEVTLSKPRKVSEMSVSEWAKETMPEQYAQWENATDPEDKAFFAQLLQKEYDWRAFAGAYSKGKGDPKYAKYQLPGGENYREVVLAMPIKADALPDKWRITEPNEYNPKWRVFSEKGYLVGQGSTKDAAIAMANDTASDPEKVGQKARPNASYTSSHFPNIPNYVAHMRTNERVDADGRPGLFVEEFQSDRHQEGRKKGYREDNKEAQMFQEYLDAKGKKRIDLERELKTQYPEWKQQYSKFESFAKNKQSLIQDQQSGRVADAPFRTTWPLQLFKRALRDAVDSGKEWVGWTTGNTQNDRFDLSKQIGKVVWNEDTKMLTAYDPSQQRTVIQESNITADKLEDYVGKEVASKLIEQSPDEDMDRSLSGLDLRVGGSGMKGFYDTMLPKEIGKYVSKFKGKVEKSKLVDPDEMMTQEGLAAEGLSTFQYNQLPLDQAESLRKKYTIGTPIWKVSITPEMRQLAQRQMRFMPEGERKTIDQNIPEKEGGNMSPSTWDSLKKVGYNPEASEKTQIATTFPTYVSIVKANATQGMEVLDFSAGRGIGTKAMKEIGKKVGFNVEGYEPFSNKKTRVIAPEYEGEESINKIPDNSKDIIVNNAVLNVVPESTGRQIVNQIYSKLKPGGSAFISVMGWSGIKSRLENQKTKLVGPREVVTQKGTFQKGYTAQSLRSLIEQELPDAKIVRTSHGGIGFKVTKPAPPAETMPAINPPAKTGQMRFLPEPVEKLSAFKGKRVQVLTSDLSLVGDIKYGNYTARFQGGPGYLDNDGWGFTDKDAADGFVTRWKRDGKPLIGLASLGSANHLNSLESRKSYAEKWKYLIQSGKLNKSDVDAHIKDAMSRIINSEAKKVKTDWVNAAKMIENADDLANYFDKIPWAAAPMFYEKLTAKTLPIKHSTLVENGLDLESVEREYKQPEYESADLGDLYAIAEYDGSEPEYSPDLNRAYPWRIKFKKKATLSEMHNVADLTTDPRAFAGLKVGNRLGAQPLMVTGIQLDKLMSGDIKPSGKPVSLKKDTPKTKSNKATEFSTGNPKAYKSYEQIMAERELEKPKPKKKSTAKGNSSAIANAAKLK